MTVQDVLSRTIDYQDFSLVIKDFGCYNCLFKIDSYDIKDDFSNVKFLNKNINTIKFGDGWLLLILEIGEEK